jgi:2-polyprenyl-3-methyl-5-hydroxy-6-metoxy-1,4-benzoquinol methylase
MATQPNAAPQPSPMGIFTTLNAYQQTYALRSAIELDIFTRIGEGASSAAEIAPRCNASERGMRILCDYLTILGFLTKTGTNYGLTPDSALFLDKRSPAYLGSIAFFLAHERHTEHYRELTNAVRRGGTSDGGNMAPDDPVWVEFARSMTPMMSMAAARVAPLVTEQGRAIKVLDIAAGHGLYGIHIAKYNAAAEIFAVDWKNVLEVARDNAAQAGVARRFHSIPGSAFEVDLGMGYDVVMLPAFVHHFDPPTNVSLLRKIRAAMKPDGLLATVELIPNADRVSPPVEAAFSMMMLGSTPAGDAYTFSDLEAMLCEAGFRQNQMHPLHGLPLTAVLSRM